MWIKASSPLLGACPPPDVATLGERGRPDDFRRHPGVGAGSAHLGGAVPLAGQPKVGYLQGLVAQVLHLHLLQKEDWERGRGWEVQVKSRLGNVAGGGAVWVGLLVDGEKKKCKKRRRCWIQQLDAFHAATQKQRRECW